MKIVLNIKDPRFRASPRHGGQGVFLLVTDPPHREAPVGGGSIHRIRYKRGVTISASYLNTTIFTGDHLFLITIFGASPATVAASLVISAENRFRVVCYF